MGGRAGGAGIAALVRGPDDAPAADRVRRAARRHRPGVGVAGAALPAARDGAGRGPMAAGPSCIMVPERGQTARLMTDLIQFLHDCPVVSRHRPWPRIEVDAAKWQMLAARLPMEEWELLALWGAPDAVHVALHDPQPGTFAVLSRACPGGALASLFTALPGALRPRRAARDPVGVVPAGSPAAPAWADHRRPRLR